MTIASSLKEFLQLFFSFSSINFFFTWDVLVFIIISLFLFFIAKWNYNKLQPNFKLDYQLLENDNKALAISFMGYLIGIGIILGAVLKSETSIYFLEIKPTILADIIDFLIWFIIGTILLNTSRIINNKFILKEFDNEKEIIKDKNIGTGIVQLGSYVASALLVSSLIINGEQNSFFIDIFETVFFFILGQLFLIIFSYLYNKTLPYNLHAEIEKDNEAVGIAFGLNLIAIGIIITFPSNQDGNFLFFLIWFINGTVILFLSRVFLDKIIFHKSRLHDELVQDKNWGIALIEGSIAIIISLVINSSFS